MMLVMTEEATANFTDWLKQEMDKRQWSQADLARYAGITDAALSRILNKGDRKPGPDVCNAIASALGYPSEKVFRLAGLLPGDAREPGGLSDRDEELLGWFHQLDEARQWAALEMVKGLVVRQAKRRP